MASFKLILNLKTIFEICPFPLMVLLQEKIPSEMGVVPRYKLLQGRFQKRFSGFCPLREYPPLPPPYPINGKSVRKKEGFFP